MHNTLLIYTPSEQFISYTEQEIMQLPCIKSSLHEEIITIFCFSASFLKNTIDFQLIEEKNVTTD